MHNIILFLSFTHFIGQVVRKQVDLNRYEKLLFYFGCTKEHVFEEVLEDGESSAVHEIHWFMKGAALDEKKAMMSVIQKELIKAEAEGRVLWRNRNLPVDPDKFIDFLFRNGVYYTKDDFKRFASQDHNDGRGFGDNYLATTAAIHSKYPDLDIRS